MGSAKHRQLGKVPAWPIMLSSFGGCAHLTYLPSISAWESLTSSSPEVRQIYPSEPAYVARACTRFDAARATSVRAIRVARPSVTSPSCRISLATALARPELSSVSWASSWARSAATRGRDLISLTCSPWRAERIAPVGACSISRRSCLPISALARFHIARSSL